MDYFIDFIWRTASILSVAGLAAALIGLGLIAFGLVDYFKKHRVESDQSRPRAAWGDPWAKLGYVLFVCGLALSALTFGVRLLGYD